MPYQSREVKQHLLEVTHKLLTAPPRDTHRASAASQMARLASHVREGVALEEKERSSAMGLPKEVDGFVEGEDLLLLFHTSLAHAA